MDNDLLNSEKHAYFKPVGAANLIPGDGVDSIQQKDFTYSGESIVFSDGTRGTQEGDVVPGAIASGIDALAVGGLRYDYYTSSETHEANLLIDSESTENWGRTPTSAEGNQSFAFGGSSHAYGDWSFAGGKDSEAYQKASVALGGGAQAGMTEEEFNAYYWDAENNTALHGGLGKDSDGNILDYQGDTYSKAYSFAFAAGEANVASGRGATAVNRHNIASGIGAFAAGLYTEASGDYAFAAGTGQPYDGGTRIGRTTASGKGSFATGNETEATGNWAMSSGWLTDATGDYSNARGYDTTASGIGSEAIGQGTAASGRFAVSEGINTRANGWWSHAAGIGSVTNNWYTYAGGMYTKTGRNGQTVIGQYNVGRSNTLFEVGDGTADTTEGRSNAFEVLEDGKVKVYKAPIDDNDVVRRVDARNGSILNIKNGEGTSSIQQVGFDATASGTNSFAIGGKRYDKLDDATKSPTLALGNQSFAGGGSSKAEGDWGFAFGKDVNSYGKAAVAFGGGTQAGDIENPSEYSFAFAANESTTASARGSAAFGWSTSADGEYSFATGSNTHAEGTGSFTQGYKTHTSGAFAMAAGDQTWAFYDGSAAFGQYTKTGRKYQFVTGICNVGKDDTLFEVGIGTSDTDRKNAFEIYQDGTVTVDATVTANNFFGNTVAVTNIQGTTVTATTVTADTFYANSDKRLKENITPYISKKSILDLPVYEFDYLKTKEHTIGCLAQDLKEICPEIVNEGEDGYLSINESKLVYLLLEEVKQLKKRLDEGK